MKKYLKYLVVVIAICFVNNVNAEQITSSRILTNEYVSKKDSSGVVHYMNIEMMKDKEGIPAYCLQPFINIDFSKDYVMEEPYSNLTSEQLLKIELLSYFGYGFDYRTSDKWYAITQVLIWRTIVNDNDIYFTNVLNGSKIDKYIVEINELLNDVNNYIKNEVIMDYKVTYGSDVILNLYDHDVIKSDYEIVDNKISNVVNDGKITFRRKSNYYSNNRRYLVNNTSQHVMVRGNVNYPTYDINIDVLKGNIKLDIKNNYIVKDFNVCYEIYGINNVFYDKVCTDKDVVYQSIDLPYGDYVIKMTSISDGYLGVEDIKVTLDKELYLVNISNEVIKNNIKINMNYCTNDNCLPLSDFTFDIYSDDLKVGSIVTDSNGNGVLELCYGKYLIKPTSKLEGYSDVSEFNVDIYNNKDNYEYTLSINMNETVVDESNITSGEIIPPNTGISNVSGYVIGGLITMCGISEKLKKKL